jgi:hypothetical protein
MIKLAVCDSAVAAMTSQAQKTAATDPKTSLVTLVEDAVVTIPQIERHWTTRAATECAVMTIPQIEWHWTIRAATEHANAALKTMLVVIALKIAAAQTRRAMTMPMLKIKIETAVKAKDAVGAVVVVVITQVLSKIVS